MSTKAHSLLTGSDLHEPKGVTTALVGQIYAADGSGSGAWKKLDATNLSGLANPFGASLLHVREQQSNGVATTTSTAVGVVTRTLNTTLTNEITSASLSSNQISLPAGTYYAEINATSQFPLSSASPSDAAMAYLWDVTHSIVIVQTPNYNAQYVIGGGSNSYNVHVPFNGSGRFTLSGTSAIELRHTSKVNGLNGVTLTGGFTEVYSNVYIWKVT